MRKQKMSVIALIFMLICAAGFGTFIIATREKKTGNDTVQEVTVSDEATLRELLLEDSEMIITVDEDIDMKQQFVVNGVKTLKGDARIKMSLSADFAQFVFYVSPKASLTMEGLTLDGNYIASGIYVAAEANMTYLSGTIEYTERSAIDASGTVTIKDISINEAQHCGIIADNKSNVSMEGGSIINAEWTSVYVAQAGYMSISGDTVIDTCRRYMVNNSGTLEIKSGTFANCGSYTMYNTGKLTIAAEKKGDVEIYGSVSAAVYTLNEGESSISGVYIHDTDTYAVLAKGKNTTVSNCTFENNGNNAMDLRAGECVLKDVVIISPKYCGMEVETGCITTLENVAITDCPMDAIVCKGATVTGKNIKITDVVRYGIVCRAREGYEQSLKLTDVEISGVEKYGVYIPKDSSGEIENLEMHDFVGDSAMGIHVAKGGKFVLSGNGKITKIPSRAAYIRGEFIMNGGEICDIVTQNAAAGVLLADGSFVMNGGQIHDNISQRNSGGIRVEGGECVINGGQIYNNTAMTYGGGISVVKEGKLYMKSGEVKNNRATSYGDGVFVDKSSTNNPILGENFYLGGNDIKIDTAKLMLQIEGGSLKKHSKQDPLLISPNLNVSEGTKVATCQTVDVASVLATKVKSGDGSFNLVQDDKYFTTAFATADMDMTGADTVRVSNFAQLKEAVTGTTGKRYVVLEANIVMESNIIFPGGSTICIMDDGNQRVISRAAGKTGTFFNVHYGTGFYLKGTKEGNLILDGTCSDSADKAKINSLINTYGSTVIDGVVIRNNGSLDNSELKGAFIKLNYGDTSIYNSTFSGGVAYTGGAVYAAKGKLYVANSTFTNNQAGKGGGGAVASYVPEVQIVNSTFVKNITTAAGGAVLGHDATKKLVVTECQFEANQGGNGGALSIRGEGSYAIITNSSEKAAFVGNTAVRGGAIRVSTGAHAVIKGVTFENNISTQQAGAVVCEAASTVDLMGSAFYGNTAKGSGGAVLADASAVNVMNCEFGKENAGNRSNDKGGAIAVTGNSTVDLSLVDGYTYNSFNYNTSKISGGAISVESGTVTAKGYTFTGNESVRGGAIFIYGDGVANLQQNEYVKNVATTSNGGAVNCAGALTDIDSIYRENIGNNGGGLYVAENGKAVLSGTNGIFVDNTANARGGAIYVFTNSSLEVHDYDFAGSQPDDKGVICFRSTTTFGNVKNAIFERYNKGVQLVVDSYLDTDNVTIKPSHYEAGLTVLTRTENLANEIWTCAYQHISLADSSWKIDANGKLESAKTSEASITLASGTVYFDTLEEAVEYANEHGGTGDADSIVITVLNDVALAGTENLKIKKNMQLVNAPGKTVTIKRGTLTNAMFYLSDNCSQTFTLGSNDDNEVGALVVDAAHDDDNTIGNFIVSVRSGATFILSKNVTLQNAKSSASGAAIENRGTAHLYGTIQNNESSSGAGAIENRGKVTLYETVLVENNKGTSNNTSQKAGDGAILQARVSGGTNEIIIKGGTYRNNVGVNGGVIASQEMNSTSSYPGPITIEGGLFENNNATNGGVVYAYNNGSKILTVTGGTFTNNTANAGGAFYMAAGNADITNAIIENNTASGKAGCDIEFNGSSAKDVSLSLKGYETFGGMIGRYGTPTDDSISATVIFLDTEGNQLKAETVEHESKYLVTFGKEPALIKVVAEFYTSEKGYYFDTLEGAVNYINVTENIGGTGDADAVVITVLHDVALAGTENLKIKKNMQLINAPGKTVTIKRGTLTNAMFYLSDNCSQTFTLGSNDDNEVGALVVDAAHDDDNTIGNFIVSVRSGATFILSKNATLQNAKSSVSGAAIENRGIAHLYGTIQNNESSSGAGAIENRGKVTLYETVLVQNNKGTSNNTSQKAGDGAILQARVSGGTNEIIIKGGTYRNNVGVNGGVIASQEMNSNGSYSGPITIEGGTFENNTATYGGVACIYNNGSKVFTVNGGTFQNNTATAGGAFYIASPTTATLTTITTVSIANATIQNNTAGVESTTSAVGGGAIFVSGASTVTLEGSIVENNTASGKSGCDIVFNGEASEAGSLNLNGYTAFSGIIGWYGAEATGSSVTVYFDGVASKTQMEHGKSYVVDCASKTITVK